MLPPISGFSDEILTSFIEGIKCFSLCMVHFVFFLSQKKETNVIMKQ